MTSQEAAAQADALAQAGSERELADLRAQWGDELEAAARSSDFRERAVAFRAIGQFRWRAKEELLRRGLDDESPAARGSALLSLELLSRDHPSTVNSVRPLLHDLATRRRQRGRAPPRGRLPAERLAAAGDDRAARGPRARTTRPTRELRQAAAKVAQTLKRKQAAEAAS